MRVPHETYEDDQFINVGSGSEITIKDLSELIKSVVGFKGDVVWDRSKPDGTPRKLMDSSRLFALGWKPKIDFALEFNWPIRIFLVRHAKLNPVLNSFRKEEQNQRYFMSALLNPKRTVAELKELRALTGDENGAQRVAFTPTWVKTRAWLRKKLAGLPVEIHTDAAGNLWATLRGESEKALLIGGHMDSVPNGGWLDGCLKCWPASKFCAASTRNITASRP